MSSSSYPSVSNEVTPIPVGTLAYTGTSVLDFGDTPTDYASVDVTEQAGIASTSHVRVWFQGETMANNTPEDHILAGIFTRLVSTDPTPGVGFTIHCVSIIGRFTKRFRVAWLWS